MALEMQFSDVYGSSHASSYWRIASVNISLADDMARIEVFGFKDKAASDAHKANRNAVRPFDVFGINVKKTVLETQILPFLMDGAPKPALRAIYDFVKNVKRNPDDAAAFFANAIDV
jgi:hypothetical protein